MKGKLVISYVGRIQKYKGLDQVITVLPDILKKHKNIVFLAMGKDADDMERLKKMAAELKVEKNVVFSGYIYRRGKDGTWIFRRYLFFLLSGRRLE